MVCVSCNVCSLKKCNVIFPTHFLTKKMFTLKNYIYFTRNELEKGHTSYHIYFWLLEQNIGGRHIGF